MALKVVGSNPIIHPRKREDTIRYPFFLFAWMGFEPSEWNSPVDCFWPGRVPATPYNSFPLGKNWQRIPLSTPRKGTRLDTFFKSGISFLCWNDARNGVLFQLFSLYGFWRRYRMALDRQLGQEWDQAIVQWIAIVQVLEIINAQKRTRVFWYNTRAFNDSITRLS